MRKQVARAGQLHRRPDESWLDLARVARAELTSEDAAHPIEAALLPEETSGWRAAAPGPQTVRLVFDEPQHLHRIWLHFVEPITERTQEFVLRWSSDGGRSFQALLRQQYTFSPQGATSEVEDFRVDLPGVTALELTIVPDQARGQAHASLAQWHVA